MWVQFRAIAEHAGQFEHDTRNEAGDHRRDRDVRHDDDKFQELPVHLFSDQEVLGFAHHGSDTAKCGSDGAVHDQTADK